MRKTHLPRKIRKRDGAIVPFDAAKIRRAIEKAAFEVLQDESSADRIAREVTRLVIEEIAGLYRKKIPGVESIQDVVEMTLMNAGFSQIARSYILYRERRTELRLAKKNLGLTDDLKLSINAMEILKKRYLLKDDARNIIETPGELFRRVARHVAQAEKYFKSSASPETAEKKFESMMRSREFMPNSPTLMNAGTPLHQLSACFVLPVEDSIEGIFETLKGMARIHQTGGGTGFSFSHLRPKGDLVATTKGEASGPVSFMGIFDAATGVVVQGGRRRGANMGILRCDHPDIAEFIEAKMEKNRFTNFNLSVGVTDRFMESVRKNRSFNLVNPRNGKKVKTVRAGALFDLIVNAAWRTGEPGLIFLDEINRKNPTPLLGPIEATNPCGELPLLPYESCNLASINLDKMVKEKSVDWEKLRETIRWGVRFLDDVIEMSRFPLPEIEEITRANRKIGLGVMGFADMLIRLGIPYNSEDAVRFARKLMRFVHLESLQASVFLAEERGVFPNFEKSVHAKKNLRLRNAAVNTIAPTGTISIIAGCSSGIEPLFAVSFVRHVLSGTKLFELLPLFEETARSRGFHDKAVFAEIARTGSLKGIREIPDDVKRLFTTAFDVTPEEHLKIQAAFQSACDNSVSKTINLPADAPLEDVRAIYLMAYQLKCKGITIYRYGSREDQVLTFSGTESREASDAEWISAASEYAGGCAASACPF